MIKSDPQFQSISDIYTECFENELLQQAENFYFQQQIPSFDRNEIFEYLTLVNI